MAFLLLDGFDLYDDVPNSSPDTTENTAQANGWDYVTTSTLFAKCEGLFPPPAPGVGKLFKSHARNGETMTMEKAIASSSNVCFGIYLGKESYFTQQDEWASVRADDESQWVAVQLTAEGKIQMKCHPSTNTVLHDVVITDYPAMYYVEVEVNGGNATLFVNDVQIGSPVAVGAAGNFDKFTFGADGPGGYQYMYYDDMYVTDFVGPDFVGRLGPISLVPLIPTADVTSDFTPSPAAPTTRYDKVDDNVAGGHTDSDTTYVESKTAGAKQTFTCTSELDFAGTALGYILACSCRAISTVGYTFDLLATDGANEVKEAGLAVPEIYYQVKQSPIKTALPGGVAMTKANFETIQFGVQLES